MKWRSAWHDACSIDRAHGNATERSSCRDLRTPRRTTKLPTRGTHVQPKNRPDPGVRVRCTRDHAGAHRHGPGSDQQLARIPGTGAQHRDHQRGSDPSRPAAASADQRRRLAALLEPDSDRCERCRPHPAAARRLAREIRRAAWPRPRQPRHGHRAHRSFRRGQFDRRRLSRLYRPCRARSPRLPSTPPSPRRRMPPWWPCSRRRNGSSTSSWCAT